MCGSGLLPCNHNCLCIDQDGSTALTLGAHEGHHECLPILLAHSAEVDRADDVSLVSAEV